MKKTPSMARARIAEAIFIAVVLVLGALYLRQPARQESLLQLRQLGSQLPYWFGQSNKLLVAPFDWTTVQLAGLARFDEEIEFLGCDIAVTREQGQVKVWQLTIWRALAPLKHDYAVYVHFVQPGAAEPFFAQGDHLLGQQFRAPLKPTSQWQPNEIVVDAVLLPEIFQHDPHVQIRIGVWLPETASRLQPDTGFLQLDEHGRLVICQ